jgi:hypothetical protein
MNAAFPEVGQAWDLDMAIKLNLNPDQRLLRQFGFLCFLLFGLYGSWRLANEPPSVPTFFLLGAATVGGTLGWFRPQWLRPIFVGWIVLTFPIGWTISNLLLFLLFFGVFTPMGLILRLLGKDPLNLTKPQRSSYWQDKSQQCDLSRYLRQY